MLYFTCKGRYVSYSGPSLIQTPPVTAGNSDVWIIEIVRINKVGIVKGHSQRTYCMRVRRVLLDVRDAVACN